MTPVRKSLKRSASPTPDTSVSNAKRSRTKATGVSAVSDVADAICSVSAQFSIADAADSNLLSTPQRLTVAIRAVTTDNDLTRTERIQVMCLFRRDIAAADAYLAIEDVDLRTEFIRAEIDR